MITDERAQQLAAELYDLKLQAGRIASAIKDRESALREHAGERRGLIEASGYKVSYRRQFNAEHAQRFLAQHHPDVLPQVTETVVSSHLAKSVLAPALYELLQVESGTPTITPVAVAR